MIIAHTLINSVAFIGFALFAGARVVATVRGPGGWLDYPW